MKKPLIKETNQTKVDQFYNNFIKFEELYFVHGLFIFIWRGKFSDLFIRRAF